MNQPHLPRQRSTRSERSSWSGRAKRATGTAGALGVVGLTAATCVVAFGPPEAHAVGPSEPSHQVTPASVASTGSAAAAATARAENVSAMSSRAAATAATAPTSRVVLAAAAVVSLVGAPGAAGKPTSVKARRSTSSGSAFASTGSRAASSLVAGGKSSGSTDRSEAATTTVASGRGRTVTVSSESALQAAVKRAQPGDTIALRPGTYSGVLNIKSSGTAVAPITLTAAGGGAVTLTANLRMPTCGATSPDPNRTIKIGGGASYWNIKGLNIRGGITIMGGNAGTVRQWLTRHSNDYQARRAVPGRATNDRSGILASTAYLQRQVNAALRPSLGISITDNVMTQKGIQSAMNKNGVISGNSISDIACGVGPGIWLGTFSDGWQISGNSIHDIAPSSWKHYMHEGIRIGGSSAYNVVTNNSVYNLPGDGRAFTTDEDGSWNTFSHNSATNVAIGYNDQKAGWGNRWTGNRVTTFRTAAFSFRMMDANLQSPSKDSSTYQTTVSCNTAVGGRVVFQAGAMGRSSIRNNAFNGEVQLGKNLRRYWSSQGNTWDGSTRAPAERVSETTAGC